MYQIKESSVLSLNTSFSYVVYSGYTVVQYVQNCKNEQDIEGENNLQLNSHSDKERNVLHRLHE